MQSTVFIIDKKTDFIAVKTETGEYSILEVISGTDNMEIGDIISGNVESLGGTTLFNKTKDESIDVIMQDCHCDKQRAISLIQQD